MKDVQLQNPATVTGTPTLVAGPLTDGNQALAFTGAESITVPDSASSSLAIADATSGGAAVELWVKFTGFPASTQSILTKPSAYTLGVNSAGKVLWTLTNGANTVTVTSAQTLSLNTWHQIVGVYNGDYTGVTQVGKTTTGASLISTPGDNIAGVATSNNNLIVCKYTMQENGHLTAVNADMKRYFDSPAYGNAAAVVYQDLSGEPGELLDQSVGVRVGGPDTTRHWYSFPVDANAYQGSIWLGMVFGAHLSADSIVMTTGFDLTGGTLRAKNSSVTDTDTFTIESDAVSPFGTAGNPATNGLTATYNMAVYADYTATARTGAEGHALIYIDGLLDNSTAYAHGIADSSSAMTWASSLAVSLDEVSIWDRKLTAEQVAIHYASR